MSSEDFYQLGLVHCFTNHVRPDSAFRRKKLLVYSLNGSSTIVTCGQVFLQHPLKGTDDISQLIQLVESSLKEAGNQQSIHFAFPLDVLAAFN